MYEVVEVIRKICENLQHFCEGNKLDDDKVEVINNLYATIESSDYAGKDFDYELEYVNNEGPRNAYLETC